MPAPNAVRPRSPYLVERKCCALIRLGKSAWATETPPPLFVYWKHIAALAFGVLATTSAKADVRKKIDLSINPPVEAVDDINALRYQQCALKFSTLPAKDHA